MRFYERPVQVVFADPENPGDWLNGIAFRDVIICSCCGGIFEIDEVINVAKEDGVINPIYPYADWNDLTDSVVGGMLPEGLEHTWVEDDEYKIVETAKMEDFIVSANLLPLGAAYMTFFCISKSGWGKENFFAEVNCGRGMKLPYRMYNYIRFVIVPVILLLWVIGIWNVF